MEKSSGLTIIKPSGMAVTENHIASLRTIELIFFIPGSIGFQTARKSERRRGKRYRAIEISDGAITKK
jgi:hypothetical protein